MFSSLLPIFAAVGDATAASSGPRTNALPEFPGEYPTDKELSDYLDNVLPVLRTVYGAILRGQTPAHLTQFESGADDLTGFGVALCLLIN